MDQSSKDISGQQTRNFNFHTFSFFSINFQYYNNVWIMKMYKNVWKSTFRVSAHTWLRVTTTNFYVENKFSRAFLLLFLGVKSVFWTLTQHNLQQLGHRSRYMPIPTHSFVSAPATTLIQYTQQIQRDSIAQRFFQAVFRIRSDTYHLAGSGSASGNVDLDPGTKKKSW